MGKTPTEEIIERAQLLSQKMTEEAGRQKTEYERRHSTPVRTGRDASGNKYLEVEGQFLQESLAMAKFTADHNVFLFFLMDTFWKLHSLVSSSLRDPLIQFSMRPLIELCYGKIMYFALKDETKRKEMATKYFLCTNGMLLQNNARDDKNATSTYNHLIEELRRESDRNRFRNIRKHNYPLNELAKEMQNIFPSVRMEQVASELDPYVIGIWGPSFSKDYIGMLYSWMSQFMHGNMLLVRNMSSEKEDMRHSFKCVLIIFLSGYHLLDFTHHKILGNEEGNPTLAQLKKEIHILIDDFVKIRNINRISSPLG